MSSAVLDRLCAERDETRNAAIAIAEADSFDPHDPTFVDLQTRASELDARVASLAGLMESRQAADQLDGRLAKAAQVRQRQVDDRVETRENSSWGEAFIRSETFTDYRGRGSSSRHIVDTSVQTRALPTGVSDLVAAGFKGTVSRTDTTAPPAPTPLLDNVTSVAVSGNAIEFVAWQKKTGGAAKVAEKAAKPSVEYEPVVTPATLDTIAVYTQLTRQLIEDHSAVRDLIDGELRRDVLREAEEEAAAALVAATLPTASGSSLLASIRVGIGTVQAAGYNPQAVLMNPADWADLDVGVMGDTLNGPIVRQSFWGLSVIPAMSQAAGTATVGDFRAGVHHFYRSAVALYITDSHADTFLANVFTLLAEQRSKTAVVRPQALVECTG